MEKEIIGYKLKEEFKEYESVAAKLFNCNELFEPVGHSNDIEKLKNAKLLDLWFEPVYKEEEYKVGDWCYIIDPEDSRLSTGKVYKINQINIHGIQDYHFDLDFKNNKRNACWLSKSSFRKATKSEIEEALLTEAKKRYPEGTKIKSALSGSIVRVEPHSKIFINSKGNIDNGFSGCIYANGKWAEIIETTPDITINGYKAEFFDDYVKFGCAKINKYVFINLVEVKYYLYTNRQIESVTIGAGTFSKKQIKAIVEYYKNK